MPRSYLSREGECETGCGERIWAKRLCRTHYGQLARKNRTCDHCDAAFVGHGRQRWCSTCCPSEQARHRMRRYGISEPEFLALSDAQQGLCALCARPHQAVDHSPSTGDVRGLLCHYCNGRLHAFDHNPEWLSRATAYVEGR